MEVRELDTRFETKEAQGVDVEAVASELQTLISGEVKFDKGTRALYATDASNYRQIPIGVVFPKSREDIITTIAVCKKYGAPVLSRGGATSLAGQCCNVAVILDMSKHYNRILEFDEEEGTVTVEPGIVLDDMRHFTEKSGWTFGPDPATHDHCTIGGMIGNNSCGVHSVMAQFEGDGARMSDNIVSLTVLTYDGAVLEVGPTSRQEFEQAITRSTREKEIYQQLDSLRSKYEHLIRAKFPNIPRRVSGYNLPDLLPEHEFNVAKALVGSEGTCVVVLSATLKLLKAPACRSLLVLGYPDVFEAGRHVMEVLKYRPIGLEGIDHKLIEYMTKKHLNVKDIPLLPKGKGWLIVEFGGNTKAAADAKAKALMEELQQASGTPHMKLFDDDEEEKQLWEIRESGLGATAWVPGEPASFPGWEDSAVPPEHVGEYLKDLRDLFHKYGYDPSLYGHFGQGCIHCRVGFDLVTAKGLSDYKAFTREAAYLVVRYGGSVSGEHGDGQARSEVLEIMYGKELLKAFHEFKTIWDPEHKMNPGKIIDSYGQLANLRLGTHYQPAQVDTVFSYPEDAGNFAHATLRCVGVGKCRRSEGGTMCPSYKVTKEEEHSTRGRARLLFEMMQGDVVESPWRNKQVKEALDLCLACKGCKHDCPVQVDMATYKAEFLSHYYEGRIRPRIAYFFGRIHMWARIAAPLAGLVNYIARTPPLSSIFKWIGGIAPKREIPSFAKKTFRKEFVRDTSPAHTSKPEVILWADTFNNYFLPEILKAATRVLTAASFQVKVPEQNLCCGRPLYDFGMLNTARHHLKEILTTMRRDIRRGIPIVGLEPSCVAVFRDELVNLFPHDEDAKRLKQQTFTLAEFLTTHARDFKLPRFNVKAIVHGHCHHKAIMRMDADIEVFKAMRLNYTLLDSGCCGMAGYFGYEKGRPYDVSVAAGELVLLPEVRKATDDTLIIADGFSCRSQIEQQTGKRALHLAEVIDMALHQSEEKHVQQRELEPMTT